MFDFFIVSLSAYEGTACAPGRLSGAVRRPSLGQLPLSSPQPSVPASPVSLFQEASELRGVQFLPVNSCRTHIPALCLMRGRVDQPFLKLFASFHSLTSLNLI